MRLRHRLIARDVFRVVPRIINLQTAKVQRKHTLDDRVVLYEFRMRKNRHAARIADQRDGFLRLNAVMRHIGRLPVFQEFVERLAHRADELFFHKRPRHVRASDGARCTGNLQHVRLRDRVADPLQFFHHQGKARPARLGEFRHFIFKRLIVYVKIVAENMDVVFVHFAAELNAGDNIQRFGGIQSLLVQMANPFHRIMIGDRDIGKPRFLRRGDNLLRREPPIRKSRMDV